VIARTWRGWTRREDADTYVDYVRETGLKAYRATPGIRGAWALQRDGGDRTEIVTLSFWDSIDAVRAFAGDNVERAVFYPEDDRFLVEREVTVRHYRLQE
jgi:heme-degrading monooxygenase HmoA